MQRIFAETVHSSAKLLTTLGHNRNGLCLSCDSGVNRGLSTVPKELAKLLAISNFSAILRASSERLTATLPPNDSVNCPSAYGSFRFALKSRISRARGTQKSVMVKTVQNYI